MHCTPALYELIRRRQRLLLLLDDESHVCRLIKCITSLVCSLVHGDFESEFIFEASKL